MPRGFGETLAGLGGAFTRVPRGTLPIGTSDQQQRLPTRPYAHGVQPLQGWALRAGRPRVASQARQPWAGLSNAFGVALSQAAKVQNTL